MRTFMSGITAALGLAAWLGGAVCGAARAESATYTFDKPYTNVSFSWNHLGLSRHSGRILDVDGTLEFDPESPETGKVEVTMKAASIVSGVAEFDRQLRSADYFDAARHPAITFKSMEIKKTGEKTGEVTGDLNILGIVKPVTLKVTWNFSGEHPLSSLNASYRDRFVAGFSGRAKLNRSDWGLKRGTPLVSDEIEIVIETELNRK